MPRWQKITACVNDERRMKVGADVRSPVLRSLRRKTERNPLRCITACVDDERRTRVVADVRLKRTLYGVRLSVGRPMTASIDTHRETSYTSGRLFRTATR